MKKRPLNVVVFFAILASISIFYLAGSDYLPDLYLKKIKPTLTGRQPTDQDAGHAAGHAVSPTKPQAISSDNAQPEEISMTPEIEIPADRRQVMGIKTDLVALRPFWKIVRTSGRIEYDERKIATVNAKYEGWIEKLYVDYTGRSIKKDEPLAEIYSPELVATQQEFLTLLRGRTASEAVPITSELGQMLAKDAEAIIEAAKARLRLWDITEDQIKKIAESGKPLRTLTLFSPVHGHVIQKMAVRGMRVMPGEKLFDIADLSQVWVIADIYEYELPLIKIGQPATIRLSYSPDQDFFSEVDYIYPTLAPDTRTAKVRFILSNPDGRLKPQMFTTVELKINLGKRLSVPQTAVIDTGRRQIVYVDKGDGFFEPREIERGLGVEGLWEVIRGLKAGEKVASSGTFLIDSEAQLKGIKPLVLQKRQ